MNLKNLFNKIKGERISAGSNITRPGGTILLTQPHRFGITLDDYINAIRSAENVDFTQRTKLYDLFSESLMDPHLFSVTQKRKAGTLGRKIEFRVNGVPDEKVNVQISSPWFLRFVEDVLDAQFWGFSLFQFYINEKGWIDYFLVPRKHVDPVLNILKRQQSDIIGLPLSGFADMVMVSGKEPLGILARTAPYVIYKLGTMGDWAQYSEIFGMPVRKYGYDAGDPTARQNTLEAAREQGSAGVFLCPDGVTLEFVESGSKNGSSELYASLVDRCNSEMSKAVLGNTLTTEASETGTQALGTVHKEIEDELTKQDGQFLLNVLNYEMTDEFASLGINTDGGEFVFVEEKSTSVKEKADIIDKAVNVIGIPLDDDYIYEKLELEKPADYNKLKQEMQAKKAALPVYTNKSKDFFGYAPQTDGADLEY